MPSITFHQPDGTSQTVEFEQPTRVMQAAITNGIPGIIGECGGQAMCATCHVYVTTEHLDQLPAMSEEEEEMLEITAAERDIQSSRLGCQIEVGVEGLNHLEVRVPSEQA